ncbi:MAG: Hemoglobin-like protein HbO [uncultured Thiotrichaceae bacterium]|uniref:Hemoglobin-like protein HbO n=1 Tax=uncultured Thiotrichaceae bacterium TaxID=298394 RepID=A0A6S6UHJ5_9GAMM|nr:MAG: Hemoglobin-like protein HbO [uncultured Thiotrichaceae bacterium]
MTEPYGIGSATYDAAGGINGIRQLVDDFYTIMDESEESQDIRKMHPEDLEVSKDKLACFLSGWMGGEALYQEKYGSINIPGAHSFLKIGEKERDMWMLCMAKALGKQDYADDLRRYLFEQLFQPAEKIRQVSEARHANQ